MAFPAMSVLKRDLTFSTNSGDLQVEDDFSRTREKRHLAFYEKND